MPLEEKVLICELFLAKYVLQSMLYAVFFKIQINFLMLTSKLLF